MSIRRANRLRSRLALIQIIEKGNRPTQMRDDDRSTDRECNTEDFKQLLIRHAFLLALRDVIRNAVIASQDHRGDEPEHLLRLCIQFAGFIGERVNAEESFDGAIVDAQYTIVHFLAERLKFLYPFTHEDRFHKK